MTNKKSGSNAYQRDWYYIAQMQGQGSRHSGFGYFISFDIHRCIAKLLLNKTIYGLALTAL